MIQDNSMQCNTMHDTTMQVLLWVVILTYDTHYIPLSLAQLSLEHFSVLSDSRGPPGSGKERTLLCPMWSLQLKVEYRETLRMQYKK